MIRLDETSRKLQALLGGAVSSTSLDVVVSFEDSTDRDGRTFDNPSKFSRLSSGSAVDICDAPAPSAIREIDSISIFNADSTSATVTVRYNDAGTTRTIVSVALPASHMLMYSSGLWHVLGTGGERLQ